MYYIGKKNSIITNDTGTAVQPSRYITGTRYKRRFKIKKNKIFKKEVKTTKSPVFNFFLNKFLALFFSQGKKIWAEKLFFNALFLGIKRYLLLAKQIVKLRFKKPRGVFLKNFTGIRNLSIRPKFIGLPCKKTYRYASTFFFLSKRRGVNRTITPLFNTCQIRKPIQTVSLSNTHSVCQTKFFKSKSLAVIKKSNDREATISYRFIRRKQKTVVEKVFNYCDITHIFEESSTHLFKYIAHGIKKKKKRLKRKRKKILSLKKKAVLKPKPKPFFIKGRKLVRDFDNLLVLFVTFFSKVLKRRIKKNKKRIGMFLQKILVLEFLAIVKNRKSYFFKFMRERELYDSSA